MGTSIKTKTHPPGVTWNHGQFQYQISRPEAPPQQWVSSQHHNPSMDQAYSHALRKEPLTVYVDGKQTRIFQYVSDLVEGLMRLIEGEQVVPFNHGNPGEFTMLELAHFVTETIDPNAKIEFIANTEDEPHKRKPDITKEKDLLGWEPKVSLRKGLPLMVEDFCRRVVGDEKDGCIKTNTHASLNDS